MRNVGMGLTLATFMFWSNIASANGYEGYIISLDAALQKKIQERLIEEGYDPGRVDGKFGPNSVKALMRYRVANDLLEDDVDLDRVLTPKLARALLGVEIEQGENGEELNPQEQLEVLRALGLVPSASYWRNRDVILP